MLSDLKDLLHETRRPVLIAIGAAVLIWVTFFDSHSLWSRYSFYQQRGTLLEENARLKSDIEQLEDRLAAPLTDEDVIRIAREELGMSRRSEVVYPVRRGR